MPILDRRSPLVPANARAADVAASAVERIAPIQRSRQLSAHRVQGIPGILYNRMTQGRPCSCSTKEHQVEQLAPDGKASPGVINRVISGSSNFGVAGYREGNPFEVNAEIQNTAKPDRQTWIDEPFMGDDGQASTDDLDALASELDLGRLGLTDISCPICFGTNVVGGYTMFRGWRHVAVPTDFETLATLELPLFSVEPGSHSFTVVLPKGARSLDAFRTFNGRTQVSAVYHIDDQPISYDVQHRQSVLRYFDGLPHKITVTSESSITHVELQANMSDQQIYLELPKRGRTADLSMFEQAEPFAVHFSPDVPQLRALDVVAESQQGKILVVQTVTPWTTSLRSALGFEASVRVAQPQELWTILPFRRHVRGLVSPTNAVPSRAYPLSTTGHQSFEI